MSEQRMDGRSYARVAGASLRGNSRRALEQIILQTVISDSPRRDKVRGEKEPLTRRFPNPPPVPAEIRHPQLSEKGR